MIQDPHAKYCRHHLYQRYPPIAKLNTRQQKRAGGFIYIYTYKLLFDSLSPNHKRMKLHRRDSDLNWLQIDNSVITNGKTTKLIQYNKSGQKNILCKIGMTTRKDVQLRLNEWENHCHHSIINLTPQNISSLLTQSSSSSKNHSLSKLFSKLSIKKHHPTPLSLSTYRNGGFYVNTNYTKLTLPQIEAFLHQLFWNKYGKGIIKCSGCAESASNSNQAIKKHLEWFNVPIDELPSILQTIDSFILSATSHPSRN